LCIVSAKEGYIQAISDLQESTRGQRRRRPREWRQAQYGRIRPLGLIALEMGQQYWKGKKIYFTSLASSIHLPRF
jgi:hypothetical protein